jgi:hypothetical protein
MSTSWLAEWISCTTASVMPPFGEKNASTVPSEGSGAAVAEDEIKSPINSVTTNCIKHSPTSVSVF